MSGLRHRGSPCTPGLDCPKAKEAGKPPSCAHSQVGTDPNPLTPAPDDITPAPNSLLEERSHSVLAMTPVPGPLASFPSLRPGSQQTTLRATGTLQNQTSSCTRLDGCDSSQTLTGTRFGSQASCLPHAWLRARDSSRLGSVTLLGQPGDSHQFSSFPIARIWRWLYRFPVAQVSMETALSAVCFCFGGHLQLSEFHVVRKLPRDCLWASARKVQMAVKQRSKGKQPVGLSSTTCCPIFWTLEQCCRVGMGFHPTGETQFIKTNVQASVEHT